MCCLNSAGTARGGWLGHARATAIEEALHRSARRTLLSRRRLSRRCCTIRIMRGGLLGHVLNVHLHHDAAGMDARESALM